MAKKDRWTCPKCWAPANGHGRGPCDTDRGVYLDYWHAGDPHQHKDCLGLICECENDNPGDLHGTAKDPCEHARCYHCGWEGRLAKK